MLPSWLQRGSCSPVGYGAHRSGPCATSSGSDGRTRSSPRSPGERGQHSPPRSCRDRTPSRSSRWSSSASPTVAGPAGWCGPCPGRTCTPFSPSGMPSAPSRPCGRPRSRTGRPPPGSSSNGTPAPPRASLAGSHAPGPCSRCGPRRTCRACCGSGVPRWGANGCTSSRCRRPVPLLACSGSGSNEWSGCHLAPACDRLNRRTSRWATPPPSSCASSTRSSVDCPEATTSRPSRSSSRCASWHSAAASRAGRRAPPPHASAVSSGTFACDERSRGAGCRSRARSRTFRSIVVRCSPEKHAHHPGRRSSSRPLRRPSAGCTLWRGAGCGAWSGQG